MKSLRRAAYAGRMKVAFVDGFGPISREADTALALGHQGLGIQLEEAAPERDHEGHGAE